MLKPHVMKIRHIFSYKLGCSFTKISELDSTEKIGYHLFTVYDPDTNVEDKFLPE